RGVAVGPRPGMHTGGAQRAAQQPGPRAVQRDGVRRVSAADDAADAGRLRQATAPEAGDAADLAVVDAAPEAGDAADRVRSARLWGWLYENLPANHLLEPVALDGHHPGHSQ